MKAFVFKKKPGLVLSQNHIQRLLEHLLQYLNIQCDEMAIYFVSKKKIGKLHQQFFHDPSPTDCITLPVDAIGSTPCFLGEIFICPEVAIEYAKEHSLNRYDETLLYLVHGVLHLSGLNDQTEKEQRIMRENEKKCMKELKRHQLGLSQVHQNHWNP